MKYNVIYSLGKNSHYKVCFGSNWKDGMKKTLDWVARMEERHGDDFVVHQIHGAPEERARAA